MAEELVGLRDALRTFSKHDGVEPKNRESERALRAAAGPPSSSIARVRCP